MDVAAWLRGLGLGRYEQAFRDHEIDGDVLPELTAEDLKDIGVTAVGHRRKLLMASAALRAGRADGPREGDGQPGSNPPQIPEGERRQVTVLFADLVGYTNLSAELDAEEIHELLVRFFRLADGAITDFGGTVDKHIGDCVMAVFGAPVAYGNDAERAVRAALEIQRRMPALGKELGRPLAVHAGVATGQVVASGTGSDRYQEYTVTGESVNLASRLTDEARGGETLISDEVHRALADQLECAEVGSLAVKGLSERVTAWRLFGLREAAATGSGRRPLVGRRRQLGQFEAALSVCRRSGRGRAIYVRGEAGIGKTRLVEEFQRLASEQGFSCHFGQVLDFGAGTGRDAIRALVRGLLGLADAGDSRSRRAAAERAVATELVAVERRVFLNDLLDLPQPRELRALYDAMDNAARNRGRRETVAALVARASDRRPRMLVVEDLHLADPSVLDHLAELTDKVALCPALLVMTSRIEGDPLDDTWRSGLAGEPLLSIDLGPLRAREAEELAGAYLDSLGDVALRCLERAAGNPLFLEQLLRHAEESAEAGVPGSVQSLVQARVDRLPVEDKRALQAASVLGLRFSPGALASLLERPSYDCTSLVRHMLVRPQGEHLLFAHALIQEGVYGSLLKGRRRELHRRAAEWFAGRDATLHAEHLDRAGAPAAPRAYFKAARAQAAEYRTERALRLAERGLALAKERADIYDLTCTCGQLLRDLGSVEASIDAYRRALQVAEDDGGRCRALIGYAAGMRVTDRLDEAFAALERAEVAARAAKLIDEWSWIHHLRGNLYFPKGNIDGCVEQHNLALRYAREAGSPEAEARALGGLGDAEYVRGRMLTAQNHLRRCIELCREHGYGRIEVANLPMLALTRLYALELAGARTEALAAVEAAARVGHLRAELNALQIASYILISMGDTARAKSLLARTHASITQLSARRFEPITLLFEAKILVAEGSTSEALELLRQAVEVARETGRSFTCPWALGALAAATSDPEVRRAALQEGEEILRSSCVSHNYLWFYRDAIEASLRAGEFGDAERFAGALETYTQKEPLPWSRYFAARGRALAAFGRGAREEATLAELRRLGDEAGRIGLAIALPAVEDAQGAAPI